MPKKVKTPLGKDRLSKLDLKAKALRLRTEKNWTQTKIAKHLGIANSTVHRYLQQAREEVLVQTQDGARAMLDKDIAEVERLQAAVIRLFDAYEKEEKAIMKKIKPGKVAEGELLITKKTKETGQAKKKGVFHKETEERTTPIEYLNKLLQDIIKQHGSVVSEKLNLMTAKNPEKYGKEEMKAVIIQLGNFIATHVPAEKMPEVYEAIDRLDL